MFILYCQVILFTFELHLFQIFEIKKLKSEIVIIL